MIRKTFALVVALAAAVPASAGSLMLGPAILHPSYGLETRYEDNIYRVPRDQNHTAVSGGGVRGSWIIANDLGLKVEAPVDEANKLNFGYGATFENYTTQSKANDAINQRADASWDYAGSKTKASLYDRYVNTHDPQFNPNGTVINGALVTREARWGNNAGYKMEYFLGDKFFFGGDVDAGINRYLDRSGGAASLANLLNTSVVTFGAKAGYMIGAKTKAYGAVHRVITHYTEGTRQDNHRDTNVDFGVDGELAPKLKGTVQTGFIYQKYDKDSANPNRATIGRHWSVLTKLDYKPTEQCQFVLTANRGTADSATTSARYFVTSGFTLAYNHTFTEKVKAGVFGGAQWDKYSE
ncbi:MAG: outer membrane beta-barrel protein, partial [Elusimicrobia bacterium]|nr:outer membrane beta-barrel protein [Elusimicrobiota bacterium]